jgi:hypothetical protein
MGTLAQSIKNKEDGVTDTSDLSLQNKDLIDEFEEGTNKVEGVLPILIGPDVLPLNRNNSDVMNNFWVNFVSRSFTNIEHDVDNIDQCEDKRISLMLNKINL